MIIENRIRHQSVCVRFLMVVISLWIFVCAVEANTVFNQIVTPHRSTTPTGLAFFYDKTGALNLSYLSRQSDRPGELNYLIHNNGDEWSSPITVDMLNQNKLDVHSVVTLSNEVPLVLMTGDNTDYAPLVSQMSQEALENLLDDNQRLFYSFLTTSGWSPPSQIANTSRAENPVIAAGAQGSAAIIFTYDTDKNPETITDRELYLTVFYNHTWSIPTKISDNSIAEFNVKLIYASGQYMAVWVTDEDKDLETRDDWKFHYAAISLSGQITKQQLVTNQLQIETVPILVESQGEAVLFWHGSPIGDTGIRRPVMTSRYSNSWSAPKATGLFGLQVVDGRIYTTSSGEMLVYYDSGVFQAALNINNSWQYAGVLADLNRSGLNISEFSHSYDENGVFWLALSAHIPAVGETQGDDEVGKGVYIARLPLAYDLAPVIINSSPYSKTLGGRAKIDFRVDNLGVAISPSYSVLIKKNDEIVRKLDGLALTPGESQGFSYEFNITHVTTPLSIEVIADSSEIKPVNNELEHMVNVLPDFVIRSVKRQEGNQIVADIVERKGVSAPPVSVNFILIEQGKQSLVATSEFDINKAEPIVVQSAELANKTGFYQIIVQVNSERTVVEDDYSNNKNSFIFNPMPDFVISRLEADSDTIRVVARNQGSLPASSIDLLITDDPEAAASSSLPSDPWFYQEDVALNDSGEAEVIFNRSEKPLFQGTALYAVVNPVGRTNESNRNNNQSKIIITNTPAVAPGGEIAIGPLLEMSGLVGWCHNIQVKVSNVGDKASFASTVAVINDRGDVMATKLLPFIMPGDQTAVTFRDLPIADYLVRTTYLNKNSQNVNKEGQVSLNSSSICEVEAVNNQDIDLSKIEILKTNSDSTELILRLTVSTVGYKTDYQKPLIRLPIRIEIKQGTLSRFLKKHVLYLPANTDESSLHSVDIPIDISRFPSGIARLEVEFTERNDESNAANNVRTFDIDVEAL